MRVWTIQPPEVLKIIEETGRFVCSKEKSQYYNDENFKGPYEWMVRKMIKNHHMMTSYLLSFLSSEVWQGHFCPYLLRNN